MKKNLLLSLASLVLLSIVWMGHNIGEAKAVQKDRTGSPFSDGTCSKSGCHNGGSFNTTTTLTIKNAQGNPITKYAANTTYDVVVMVAGTGPAGYGFQATALTATNTMAGSFSNNPVAQIIKLGNIFYIEQPFQNTSGMWKFSWTSPPKGTGPVKFYVCGLACDNNKLVSNDQSAAIVVNLEETTATYEVAKTFTVKMNSVTKESLRLQLETSNSGLFNFEILDMNGMILKSEKKTVDNGSNEITLDLYNATPGIYLLNITKSDGDKLIKKFVIN